jgi:hypothetical protein
MFCFCVRTILFFVSSCTVVVVVVVVVVVEKTQGHVAETAHSPDTRLHIFEYSAFASAGSQPYSISHYYKSFVC